MNIFKRTAAVAALALTVASPVLAQPRIVEILGQINTNDDGGTAKEVNSTCQYTFTGGVGQSGFLTFTLVKPIPRGCVTPLMPEDNTVIFLDSPLPSQYDFIIDQEFFLDIATHCVGNEGGNFTTTFSQPTQNQVAVPPSFRMLGSQFFNPLNDPNCNRAPHAHVVESSIND